MILGANGQLGKELVKFLEDKSEIYYYSHKELDVLDFEKITQEFKKYLPNIVINCAAYTKVDKSEKERSLAFKVNSIGAKNISFASSKIKAKIVYFSTDYVFDGNKVSPYDEFDLPNPLSTYGKSKFIGEIYTREHNTNHLILRISWLYGIYGSNFVKRIIKLSKEKKVIKVVNDQTGTPTYTLDVAKQLWKLIQTDSVGLYHSSNLGKATWFEFAKIIVEQFNLNVKIAPITTDKLDTLAKRPRFSVLENYLLDLEDKNIMRDWKEAFKDFIKRYRREELIR